MELNNQARENATAERQHNKIREAAMDARGRSETRQNLENNESVSESAREMATSRRQADEALKENMQHRADEKGQ